MADLIIRPSLKFVQVGYFLTALAGLVIGTAVYAKTGELYGFIALLLFCWPLTKHARRQWTKVTVSGDRLRYELGLLSKTTRTIQLSKLQDVTVHQTVGQRLASVGDVSIETAGETSRLTILNIDQPQQIADKIMDVAQHGEETLAQPAQPGQPAPPEGSQPAGPGR